MKQQNTGSTTANGYTCCGQFVMEGAQHQCYEETKRVEQSGKTCGYADSHEAELLHKILDELVLMNLRNRKWWR